MSSATSTIVTCLFGIEGLDLAGKLQSGRAGTHDQGAIGRQQRLVCLAVAGPGGGDVGLFRLGRERVRGAGGEHEVVGVEHLTWGTTPKPGQLPASESEECVRGDAALASAFEFLGKRWNGVVLGVLSSGPAGFRELSRAIGGISDSVLSDRLADLAGAGLVARTVEEGPPVSVSYALTNRGRALIPALEQISLWAQEHLIQDET
jgi:DNA-binding HxlR family transcriptional regulator